MVCCCESRHSAFILPYEYRRVAPSAITMRQLRKNGKYYRLLRRMHPTQRIHAERPRRMTNLARSMRRKRVVIRIYRSMVAFRRHERAINQQLGAVRARAFRRCNRALGKPLFFNSLLTCSDKFRTDSE